MYFYFHSGLRMSACAALNPETIHGLRPHNPTFCHRLMTAYPLATVSSYASNRARWGEAAFSTFSLTFAFFTIATALDWIPPTRPPKKGFGTADDFVTKKDFGTGAHRSELSVDLYWLIVVRNE